MILHIFCTNSYDGNIQIHREKKQRILNSDCIKLPNFFQLCDINISNPYNATKGYMDLFPNQAVAGEETAFNTERKTDSFFLSFMHKRKTSVLLSAWVFFPSSKAQTLLPNSSTFLLTCNSFLTSLEPLIQLFVLILICSHQSGCIYSIYSII